MAVRLRLARHGQTKRPFYRIVAAEHEAKRDGRFIEMLGSYDPMTEPPTIILREDRIKRWVSQGAKATGLVRSLITKNFPGIIEEKEKAQREKIQEQRKSRKARQAASR